jgi:hypothetical protein
VLGVLDAEPAVPGSVRAAHAVVDVEQHRVGSLADGVHHHLQARGIRGTDPGFHRIGGIGQQA